MTEIRKFGPEIFFSFDNAVYWIDGHLMDYEGSEFKLKVLEIVLMDSGGFRTAVVFEHEQLDLGV